MGQVCVISIYVPNLQEAIRFYTTVLGFEVDKQYGSKIVTLVSGEVPIVLEESEESSQPTANHTSEVVLGLKTDNIYQTVEKLKDHNVEFIIDEPTDCPPGKYISFRDPFGNRLEYLEFS